MRYLLVLGFHCFLYKKEPVARLFANGKLIDEFNIEKTIAPDIKSPLKHVLEAKSAQEMFFEYYSKTFPPFKIYNLNIDNTLENFFIKIEIKNEDSNFTNGFITKSTLISLHNFFLYPYDKKICKILSDLCLQNISKKNNYQWRVSEKNSLCNLLPHTTWYNKKNKMELNGKYHKFGGNGYFQCKIKKKYNIFMPDISKPCRFKMNEYFTNFFFDKYNLYENQ